MISFFEGASPALYKSKTTLAALALVCSSAGLPLAAFAEEESCRIVRMAEPGWTDLTYTQAVASEILTGLGYETDTDTLGLPVIYQSLENRDLDIFLGYWDPAMEIYYKDYRERGTVETVKTNLEGAKFTFAVPKYVHDAGVTSIADLSKHTGKFDQKMYGMEPGSNDIMLQIVADNAFGLGDWEVIESSEQGMLSQVKRAARRENWIVFVGWAPHPMNTNLEMEYLTDGDDYYGPDFGGATVHTQVRKGYMSECTNVARLLENLVFTVELESEGMGYLLDDGLSAEEAARKSIANNPEFLDAWLENVRTADGQPGLAAVKGYLSEN
ncbi:choline ABC transporter substrate-binding protein [Kiloniella sp. b19]|uniref:choline ABC transporter substrate-binding protein n=1 Tax=Kiloniella sp. GXU_MW_B19 TaxID=3141326 RepID=UPI0031DF09EB